METKTHVFFYGHKPNNIGVHIFSQWYPADFVEKKGAKQLNFKYTEQYMMAHKALLFDDTVIFKKIMSSSDPGEIKQLGRQVKNFNPTKWGEHKFEIVTEGNRLKFGQNLDMLDRLLKTEEKIIVEASPYDKIWGIGLSIQDAIKIPEDKWPGQNLLGQALMRVRAENTL